MSKPNLLEPYTLLDDKVTEKETTIKRLEETYNDIVEMQLLAYRFEYVLYYAFDFTHYLEKCLTYLAEAIRVAREYRVENE